MASRLLIGCAGWALPKSAQAAFLASGTHLQRYASRFSAVEINSSFYRPHSALTYARWARSVPEDFRFAVKLPKTITHLQKLHRVEALLAPFIEQVQGLEQKLGCLLIQLPPSLAFDAGVAQGFFRHLRQVYLGGAALEPRHSSWFNPAADGLLQDFAIARAVADPPIVKPTSPGGDKRLVYFRLHGQPRMYYSSYAEAELEAYAKRLRAAAQQAAACWCMFDNTAAGAAIDNALSLMQNLRRL